MRVITTNADAYETFIGQLSPREFLNGYPVYAGSPDYARKAVCEFIANDWPYDDEAAPTWLENALVEHIESELENA